MFPHYHLQFIRLTTSCVAALLGVAALTVPITAHGIIAGRTDFVIGKVEATATDGVRRLLAKGSAINTGDTISTDTDARAQIRFTDGGFVSLQPNSLFRVDEFNYQNKTDGAEKGFFSLLKGGLRAITGAIGRINRDTYRVSTPVATIGIRGTGYNAELNDGLFVNVGNGAISLTNNAGLLLVSAGKAAFVANINTPPAFTSRHPRNPPASMHHLRQMRHLIAEYAAGDQRDADGNLITLPHLTSGPGYAIAYTYMDCASNPCAAGSGKLVDMNAAFNTSSQLLAYGSVLQLEGGKLDTPGIVSFSATDGTLGWGRWVGNTVATGSVPSLNPGIFDYVVGIPTATMPTSGTVTYNLIGYTKPMASDKTPWDLAGAQLTANFGTSTVAVSLKITNGTDSYAIVQQPVAISGATFSSAASASPLPVTPTGSVCGQGCSASVNGFFAGDNASRAGMSYSINDATVRDIQGVAALASK